VSVTILVRNADFSVAGPLNGWTVLSATLNFNAVGVYTITLPAFAATAALIQPKAGIQIIRDGVQFMAGPIDSIGFARDGGQTDGNPGTLVINGASDLAWIANALIIPDPTLEWNAQGAATSYTRSDTVTPAAGGSASAGQLITDIVNLNCGPGAQQVNPPRTVPGLVVNPSTLGATISCQERMTPLGDTLRTLALAGGGLGFDCVQVGRQLQFGVYQPRDLSAYALFSFELGNLRQVNWTQTFPLTTRAILGGAASGSDPTISQYVNTDAESVWGRYVEAYVDDSSVSDPTQLAQDGATELSTNGEQDQLSAITVDAPTLRYGADAPGVIGYQIGDFVQVAPYPGVGLVDVVTQVTLTADGTSTGGELVTAVIGDGSTTNKPAYLRQIEALNRRVANLETGI
jgi:hypothetical protein